MTTTPAETTTPTPPPPAPPARSAEAAPAPPIEPTLTPAEARKRASSVAASIGVAQALVVLVIWFASGSSAEFWTNASWPLVAFLAGPLYLAAAWPIRRGNLAAVWIGLIAAATQALVFIVCAILFIIAALRVGEPGQMTAGVLLFGSVASIHLFVLRWLWRGREDA
ncbi:MAG: hypothetical protein ACF8PN_05240 [Phycisphaerales bacterium]